MTLVSTRLTCDGKVRVKVYGRRRKIFKVLFLDKYRRKAFRNSKFVLERLNFNIIEETPAMRAINVDYEDEGITHTQQVEIEDKVLRTLFNPGPEIQELCLSLKLEYPMIFKYDGKGVFDVSILGKLSEKEEGDNEKFVTYVIRPR